MMLALASCVASNRASRPIDADAQAFIDDLGVEAPFQRRVDSLVRMLKGEAGNWTQLSQSYASTAKVYLTQGDYQTMPSTPGDNFATIKDLFLSAPLTPTGTGFAADREMHFRGGNYLVAAMALITDGPWWIIVIGNCHAALAAQQVIAAQNTASNPGRTNFLYLNSNDATKLTFYESGGSGFVASDNTTPAPSSEPVIMGAVNYGAGAGNLRVYTNGVQGGTTNTGNSSYTLENVPTRIGRRTDNGLPLTNYSMQALVIGRGFITVDDFKAIGNNIDLLCKIRANNGFGRWPQAPPVSQVRLAGGNTGASVYAFAGTGGLLRLDNGDLLCTSDTFGVGSGNNKTLVHKSTGNGASWEQLGSTITGLLWPTPFKVGSTLYMLGTTTDGSSAGVGQIVIAKSTNDGASWALTTISTGAVISNAGMWHLSKVRATLERDGKLFFPVERGDLSSNGVVSSNGRPRWVSVISFDLADDPTDPANWEWSNEIDAADYRTPFGLSITAHEAIECQFVEGEAVYLYSRITWAQIGSGVFDFDPGTNTLAIYGPDDTADFGECAFHPVKLPEGGYVVLGNADSSAGQKRHKLAMWYSPSGDPGSWVLCDTGTALPNMGVFNAGNPGAGSAYNGNEGVQYPHALIDSENPDDLIFASRTAFNGAHTYHNTNRITFHRLANFRNYLPS